jgi:hypothetical protein
MDNAFRSLGTLFLVVIIGFTLGLSGCDNPGPIGSSLTGSGADLVVDTFTVEDINISEYNSYSGDFAYFSTGAYQDPLFGNMSATGLVKPSLVRTSDTVSADAKMIMRIFLDKDQIYGDSLASQHFDIYEIAERWRGKSSLVKDSIRLDQNSKVGSFTVEEEQDSLDVDITSWLQKEENYRTYTQMESSTEADSLYLREVFGMGLVPTNSNKIVPIIADSMEFHIQNPESDTLRVGLEDWAYSLKRENNNSFPNGSVPLYSTYESVLNFKKDFSALDIRQTGIAKAELVFYRNNSALEQSLQSEPSSVVRPIPARVLLHLANPAQAPVNLDPGDPITSAEYSESDGAYHFNLNFNIQSLLSSNIPENLNFFVTFSNDGIIKPSLIYTDGAPADKTPKLIISYIKNTDN